MAEDIGCENVASIAKDEWKCSGRVVEVKSLSGSARQKCGKFLEK